ncbi:MAG: PKD domain-containing protein [Thermoleophilaceae bacterium]
MPSRIKALARAGATLLAWAALAVAAAAPATAADGAGATNPHGRLLGAVPALSAAGSGANRLAPAETVDPLAYHGGPVVHDGHVYAIFWEPPGYSFPPDYKTAVVNYFRRVAADSGKRTNVYSVNHEYPDALGVPAYRVAFENSYTDTTILPSSGCANPSTDVCLTDAQISSELAGFVLGHGLPRGLARQYFIFTPPGVGSCFDSGSDCAYEQYCAYHSSIDAGGILLYAVHPHVTGVGSCDVGESPTGTSADAVLNVVSHEHVEIVTDPLGNAWFDSNGEENGDKCAWRFGSLSGSPGGLYNQLIGGARYLLQLEWSNAAAGCVARVPANKRPQALFSQRGRAIAGNALLFDASRARDDDGQIASYRWDFGDGKHAAGRLATHAYARGGTYRARLTVTDDDGATATSTVRVVIAGNGPKHKKHRKHKRHKKHRKHRSDTHNAASTSGLAPRAAR